MSIEEIKKKYCDIGYEKFIYGQGTLCDEIVCKALDELEAEWKEILESEKQNLSELHDIVLGQKDAEIAELKEKLETSGVCQYKLVNEREKLQAEIAELNMSLQSFQEVQCEDYNQMKSDKEYLEQENKELREQLDSYRKTMEVINEYNKFGDNPFEEIQKLREKLEMKDESKLYSEHQRLVGENITLKHKVRTLQAQAKLKPLEWSEVVHWFISAQDNKPSLDICENLAKKFCKHFGTPQGRVINNNFHDVEDLYKDDTDAIKEGE
ncbi:hypothetical protein ACFL3D_01965 [Candidatus Omnitrophota bacterium]